MGFPEACSVGCEAPRSTPTSFHRAAIAEDVGPTLATKDVISTTERGHVRSSGPSVAFLRASLFAPFTIAGPGVYDE
jgi:hypothetical protein